jgi:hypothetical protein
LGASGRFTIFNEAAEPGYQTFAPAMTGKIHAPLSSGAELSLAYTSRTSAAADPRS